MPKRYAKLRGRIVEKFGTIGAFCDAIGMSRQGFSKKLNGEVPFTTDQIDDYMKILEISPEDVFSYFF